MKSILKLSFLMILVFSCNLNKKKLKKADIVQQAELKVENEEVNNKSFQESKIKLKSVEIIEKNSYDNQKYELISILKIDLNNDDKRDEIIFERPLPWYDDPGDFHKITIACKGTDSLILKNPTGWITFKSQQLEKLVEKLKQSGFNFSVSEYFITKQINKQKKLVLLLNYPYASHPYLFTIILIENNKKPKIVFNSYLNIEKVVDINKDDKIELIGTKAHKIYEVYTLNDFFEKDNQLSLNYNLDQKKHRKYPLASIKLLKKEDIESMTIEELNLMKYEIYADNKINIQNEKWSNYFKTKSWYVPKLAETKSNLVLSDSEKKNIELINIRIKELEEN